MTKFTDRLIDFCSYFKAKPLEFQLWEHIYTGLPTKYYTLQKMNIFSFGFLQQSVYLLTQIRNIRKTILLTQMPSTILKTCVSVSAMKHSHVTLAPSFPPHPSTHPSPAVSVSLKHSRRSQLRLNPDSFMMVIQIPR